MNAQAIVPETTRDALADAIRQVNGLVLGKRVQIDLAFACLLAGGHLLIEDLPGLGKTTLARSMAATLGLSFQRMQFTADLLPSDILGVSVYEQDQRAFRFHPGPLFTQLLLADEINRAPPRTQSALLEAMAEQQVTIDGTCHRLPSPFFVIATQNPTDLAGTFALPDSQLDRFLIRIELGHPDAEAERAMLTGESRDAMIARCVPVLGTDAVLALRRAAANVHASPHLVAYVHDLVQQSRKHPGVRVGLSPRAGLALLGVARALSLVRGDDHVAPETVQSVFTPVASHRLVVDGDGPDAGSRAREILETVALP